MEHKEYKRREFIGDAIGHLIARLHYVTESNITYNTICGKVCSNQNFGETALKIGLVPYTLEKYEDSSQTSWIWKCKSFADAYEVKLYNVYMEEGFDAVMIFFKETAIANYEGTLIKTEV